jgi:hypothetical protein
MSKFGKRKHDDNAKVKKRFKASWMGHGAWMRIAWGTW